MDKPFQLKTVFQNKTKKRMDKSSSSKSDKSSSNSSKKDYND